MLGESWAVFMSDPCNEVDSITPDHSLTQYTILLALSPTNLFLSLPTTSVLTDSLPCIVKKKEAPPGQKGACSFAWAFWGPVWWSSVINHFPKWKRKTLKKKSAVQSQNEGDFLEELRRKKRKDLAGERPSSGGPSWVARFCVKFSPGKVGKFYHSCFFPPERKHSHLEPWL